MPDVPGVQKISMEVSIKTVSAQLVEVPEVTYSMAELYMPIVRHFREGISVLS